MNHIYYPLYPFYNWQNISYRFYVETRLLAPSPAPFERLPLSHKVPADKMAEKSLRHRFVLRPVSCVL